MLEPQERRLLYDILKPPQGYAIDSAIATTFSLDLLTLLGVPLAFTSFQIVDDAGRHDPSSAALLEAARRHSEQVSVFCQAGQIIPPGRRQPLLAFLESSVTEVSPGETGVFHPKVWILRYVRDEQPILYRVASLSRNLTNSKAWDVSAVVEGELQERQQGYGRNRPLGEFVAALAQLPTRVPIAPVNAARAALFAEELRRVDFVVPTPFSDFAFHPIGIAGQPQFPNKVLGKRALVIAPFVAPKTLGRLTSANEDVTLVSRGPDLDRIQKAILEKFTDVFVMREESLQEEPSELRSAGQSTWFDETLRGLHAKIYVGDAVGGSTIWIGSANATNAAFSDNVEFLISFTGPKRIAGVDAVLNGGNEDELGLRKLLVPYQPPEIVTVDELQEKLEDRVDTLRRWLSQTPMVARVAPVTDGFHLELVRPATDGMSPDPSAAIQVWPITLPQASARPFDSTTPIGADFGTVTKAALTTFFAFSIEVKEGGKSAACSFAVNLPLEGAPEGRRADLIRELLSDEAAITRFLLLMLSDDLGATESGESIDATAAAFAGSAPPNADQLLELLLRHLHRSPGRIDELSETIAAVFDQAGSESKLPVGFAELWAPIKTAREQLRIGSRK
jgi:hypothetical protein